MKNSKIKKQYGFFQLFNLIIQLTFIDMMKQYKGSIFSWLWILGAPILFTATYIFGLAIGGDFTNGLININGVEYSQISWLLIGSSVWTYIGTAVVKSCNSIKEYRWIVVGIGVPIFIPPIFTNLSKLWIGIFSFILSVLVYIIIWFASNSSTPIFTWHLLQVPLVFLFILLFLTLLSLVMAPISAVSKDMTQIIILLPAVLAWLSAVTIQPQNSFYTNPNTLDIIMRINPFYHLLDQARQSILGYSNGEFWWVSHVSFWSFILVLLALSIFITKKFKKHIADII